MKRRQPFNGNTFFHFDHHDDSILLSIESFPARPSSFRVKRPETVRGVGRDVYSDFLLRALNFKAVCAHACTYRDEVVVVVISTISHFHSICPWLSGLPQFLYLLKLPTRAAGSSMSSDLSLPKTFVHCSPIHSRVLSTAIIRKKRAPTIRATPITEIGRERTRF